MHDLTPSYVPETGEVILDGPPAGPAGEARLVPVAGVDLAFDRADGHLVRVIVDAAEEADATALINRLFGMNAADDLRALAVATGDVRPLTMSPAAGLRTALSSLARLDATRATSLVPPSSPWWAAEAAVLAEQAGLRSRTLAEASRASCALRSGQAHGPCVPEVDVAAELAVLEKDCQPGLHWMLDPGFAPPEVFRPGLTPQSDLRVHHDMGSDCVLVQATLAPGAHPEAAGRWCARLVDPAERSVLAAAGFKLAGSRLNAELRFSHRHPSQTWIEVVDDAERPVSSAKTHRTRRALRWADAALRAERAPTGVAPRSTAADWAALAGVAWERCSRDWEAAGDPARAAAALAPRVPLPGPVCLAEVLGKWE